MATNQQFFDRDGKDGWITPPSIIEVLNEHVGIDLDPCAGLASEHARVNWTIQGRETGRVGPRTTTGINSLERDWSGSIPALTDHTVFVNPPFSQKAVWITKVVEQLQAGHIGGAIVLTPDNTSTAWWHGDEDTTPRGWPHETVPTYVDDPDEWWQGGISHNAPVTWVSEGRVKFVDPETGEQAGSPSFNSALHFLGDSIPSELIDVLNEQGTVYQKMCY